MNSGSCLTPSRYAPNRTCWMFCNRTTQGVTSVREPGLNYLLGSNELAHIMYDSFHAFSYTRTASLMFCWNIVYVCGTHRFFVSDLSRFLGEVHENPWVLIRRRYTKRKDIGTGVIAPSLRFAFFSSISYSNWLHCFRTLACLWYLAAIQRREDHSFIFANCIRLMITRGVLF